MPPLYITRYTTFSYTIRRTPAPTVESIIFTVRIFGTTAACKYVQSVWVKCSDAMFSTFHDGRLWWIIVKTRVNKTLHFNTQQANCVNSYKNGRLKISHQSKIFCGFGFWLLFIKSDLRWILKTVKKKKVTFSRFRPGVAQRVGRGIALLFHDRGARRGWVVSSTPRPQFTPGKTPVPISQEAGWAPRPVWTGSKSHPHRDSIPDRPARDLKNSPSPYFTNTFGRCLQRVFAPKIRTVNMRPPEVGADVHRGA